MPKMRLHDFTFWYPDISLKKSLKVVDEKLFIYSGWKEKNAATAAL